MKNISQHIQYYMHCIDILRHIYTNLCMMYCVLYNLSFSIYLYNVYSSVLFLINTISENCTSQIADYIFINSSTAQFSSKNRSTRFLRKHHTNSSFNFSIYSCHSSARSKLNYSEILERQNFQVRLIQKAVCIIIGNFQAYTLA